MRGSPCTRPALHNVPIWNRETGSQGELVAVREMAAAILILSSASTPQPREWRHHERERSACETAGVRTNLSTRINAEAGA